MVEEVILVNERDEELGLMEKLEAHRKGLLHRAFSVFIFNDAGQLMLQQRAYSKYHSGGLWTNTCCSHPRKGESYEEAAHRRLLEEMGFDCPLEKVLDFIYRAELDKGLTEHELDHVFVGYFNDSPKINPEEVETWKWMSPEEVSSDMAAHPDRYTEWFKIIFDRFISTVNQA
ncbi:MAG: isopentenyl-diphosphate Delta-isomerase [Bacteroidota bacterium]|nr:isopentenyl-diphosphate Delta-isomerase [Bacteroidota bacterium]MDX5448672.1 isopentenyl-diphosphate Delta-isomerase [Bacteroidota bacterium]MDX5505043.1 isopentenyl-diphosphate Delta-isomerase [Bacteroidota bacterium]